TPHEAALAVLLTLADHVIPLVGATRTESIQSCLRALSIRLEPADRLVLSEKISFEPTSEAILATAKLRIPAGLRALQPGQPPGNEPEVVIIMGVQGAGKSE